MNTDFPTIEDPATEVVGPAEPAQSSTALATVRTTMLAGLERINRGIENLRVEHGSTSYDITTPHGYKLAKVRRHAVRLARYQVPKRVEESKDQLRDLGKAIEAEADRITAALLAIEKPHDDLIKAEDERKEAEAEKKRQAAAELARIEAERLQRLRDGIAKIRECAARAQGLPAARIQLGIEQVQGIDLTAFGDLEALAATAQLETLVTMRALHDAALHREAAAAELERQRIENERVAAEQKAEAERLAAERAELKRQADELAAQRAEVERKRLEEEQRQRDEAVAQSIIDAAVAASAHVTAEAMTEALVTGLAIVDGDRVIGRDEIMRSTAPVDPTTGEILTPATDTPEQGSQQVLKAEAPAPDATDRDAPATTSPDGGPMGAGQPAAAGPIVEPMSLTTISGRLGFPVQQALLGQLGIQPTARDKRAVLYAVLYAADLWPAICDALIAHITAAKGR